MTWRFFIAALAVAGFLAAPFVIGCAKGGDSSEASAPPPGPPQVVSMEPANGATNVSPAADKLVVVFDRPMGPDFSWAGGGEQFPEGAGLPTWSSDKKTCTLPVKLKPGWNYRLGLNSPSHKNFKSEDGTPLVPVEWTFSTAQQ